MATTKQLQRDQPATMEGHGSSFFTNTETFLQVLNTCCPEGSSARSPGTKRGQQASLRDFSSHPRSYSGGCRLNEGPKRESTPARCSQRRGKDRGKLPLVGKAGTRGGQGLAAAAHRTGGQETCRIRQHHSRGESARADGWWQRRCRAAGAAAVRARQLERALGRLVRLCCCSCPMMGLKASSGASVCKDSF